MRKVEEVEVVDRHKQTGDGPGSDHEIGWMKSGASEGYCQLENKDAGACRVGKCTAG